MSDYAPIQISGSYRSPSHLPMWEILEKAGIWEQVGIELTSFVYHADPPDAEAALFDGSIDFISGDHITPYALVVQGKPIVSIASPVNGVRDKIASRKKIASLSELRGARIVDRPLMERGNGFQHPTGNHILYLRDAGLSLDDIQWTDLMPKEGQNFSELQLEMLKSDKADATFISGSGERFEQAGLHVLQLDLLPMINGPTLTTSLDALRRKDRLGERLVKAEVLAIHFAHAHREETEIILEGLRKRAPEAMGVSYQGLARMPRKPYPDPKGIQNAYDLCLMKDPEAEAVSPLALWDLHYLRELDYSGFIDRLYQEEP